MSTDPLQEDKGLAKIHTTCAEMHAIWRPTPCHDLGVDGQVEFLEPGTCTSTGLLLGIQSKSGASYFKREAEKSVLFTPEPKHIRYWKRFKLPVILVLHDPTRELTLYGNVKPQLVSSNTIEINKKDNFCAAARETLIWIAGHEESQLPPAVALDKFKNITLQISPGKVITGIEFLLASTNRHAGYFELRMCRIMALLEIVAEGLGFGVASEHYDYIQRNVYQCHALSISEMGLEEFDHIWYMEKLVPDITVPLTPTGTEMIKYLWEHIDDLLSKGAFGHVPANSRQIAEEIAQNAQAASDRLDRSDLLGKAPR